MKISKEMNKWKIENFLNPNPSNNRNKAKEKLQNSFELTLNKKEKNEINPKEKEQLSKFLKKIFPWLDDEIIKEVIEATDKFYFVKDKEWNIIWAAWTKYFHKKIWYLRFNWVDQNYQGKWIWKQLIEERLKDLENVEIIGVTTKNPKILKWIESHAKKYWYCIVNLNPEFKKKNIIELLKEKLQINENNAKWFPLFKNHTDENNVRRNYLNNDPTNDTPKTYDPNCKLCKLLKILEVWPTDGLLVILIKENLIKN
jgi:GNAT superfamily N-acetyltransferase